MYQDLLRDREISLSIEGSDFENQTTNIRGCTKLKIRSTAFEINQYCNKYWTNEVIKEVCKRLDDLKNPEE